MIKALVFDVDGTFGGDGGRAHRQAFNAAFAEAGLELGMGRPTSTANCISHWRQGEDAAIRRRRWALRRPNFPTLTSRGLHERKNAHYAEIVRADECTLSPRRRAADPVVARARAAARRLHHEVAGQYRRTVEATLAPEGLGLYEAIVWGEDVAVKKPAPDAYVRVLETLALRHDECLAFEDLRNGLAAARGGGARGGRDAEPLHESTRPSTAPRWCCSDLSAFELAATGFASEAAPA